MLVFQSPTIPLPMAEAAAAEYRVVKVLGNLRHHSGDEGWAFEKYLRR